MAIIVDKEAKRKAIALSCVELLLDKGINKLTISQIAKTAGVGKGTIYEYFKNKDAIVFEIITLFIEEHKELLRSIGSSNKPTKEKVFDFFFLLHKDENQGHLKIYREFLAIALHSGTEDMVKFSMACRSGFIEILQQILQDAIDRGEIKAEALGLVDAWMIFALGLAVETHTANLNPKEELTQALDSWFTLIEEKR